MPIVSFELILLLLLCFADIVNSIEYSITPDRDQDVLAIDTTTSRLAILTSARIYLYNTNVSFNESTRYEGTTTLQERIQEDVRLLDFKLLSDYEVAYCTTATCGYCNISGATSYCKSISWQFTKKTSDQQLSTASIASVHRKLVLGLVDKNDNYAMLLFDMETEPGNFTEIKVQSDTLDIPHTRKQVVVAGFSRGNCVYFVGTYIQNIHHFEWIDDNTAVAPYEHNTTLIKLTRSCFNAQTSQIVSTAELNIDCVYYNSNPIEKVLHARYDPNKEELWLLSLKGVWIDRTVATLCRIDMKGVDARFDHDKIRCQRRSIYKKKDNLRIFHNCNSKNYSQMHWPIDYNLFKGTHYGGFYPPSLSFTDVIVDPKYGDIFYADILLGYLRVSRKNSLDSEHDFRPIFRVPVNSHLQRQAIGLSNNSIFYINKRSVLSMSIACDSFYKTCGSITLDSTICEWCSDDENQRAVHVNDKNEQCQRPLNGICPPIIESAKQGSSASEWWITGNGLDRMAGKTVTVCRKRCYVDQGTQKDNELQCKVTNGSDDDASCDINITGTLGKYKNFVLAVQKALPVKDLDLPTIPEMQDFNATTITMIIAAAAVLLLVIAVVSYLVWRSRVRKPNSNNQPANTAHENPEMQKLANGDNHNNKKSISNLAAHKSGPFYNNYTRLFQEMEGRLKIDFSDLDVEVQIGSGHFGIVNRATYTSKDGIAKVVACKMIKEGVAGVREFFTEGITMGKFRHPNVIELIGIAFTDEKIPIIITDYMPNGDLATYLKKTEIEPTLRDLLQFAVEIAEGMEYLHSMKFIHRDLAARNCMLSDTLQVKIADFGLARECTDSYTYMPTTYRDLPIPWMPFEALQNELFTFKGDVWAYGIVLWELMTLGKLRPYEPIINPYEIFEFLKKGQRLNIPANCTVQLYEEVMLPCWAADIEARPSFTVVLYIVKNIIKKMNEHQTEEIDSGFDKKGSTSSLEADNIEMPLESETKNEAN